MNRYQAIRFIPKFVRFYSITNNSSLYITGDKAHQNFAVLTPYLDVLERLNDIDSLKANIAARKIHINLRALEQRWIFYLDLLEKKQILGYTKAEISKEIAKLLPEGEKNEEEIEKYKVQAKIVKDEFSTLKEFMYGVEESAALHALSLPNVLHSKTPVDKEVVLHTYLDKPTHFSKPHIDIGVERKLIEYTNNSFVFLTNEAALFELSLINYFHHSLLHHGYTQFSNADFVRSVIIEGCGENYEDTSEVITLNDENSHTVSRLHLTGGASHYAFMAYLSRYSVNPKQFPLKFFATGRKYQPIKNHEPSFFNLMQQSSVETFDSTIDSETDMDNAFEDLVKKITNIYEPLGYHFRLTILPAFEINNFESMRLSIQMYSNHLNKYVEVGHVSVCDNYLSKRLLFTYTDQKDRKYPKVITGNVLNVQKVLACVIENNVRGDRSLLCDLLKPYAPS